MAWLEKRGERFRIKFRFGGGNFQCALKTGNEREATALLGRLEDNLILMERGKLIPPPGADLGLFLLSDGKLNERPEAERSVRLAELFKRYRERTTRNKEESTCYTECIHIEHLQRLLGAHQRVRAITTETLQTYVDARSREHGRSGPVSHVTIQKEIGTFAAIWNKWALPLGLVFGPAPTKGLVYHKVKSKLPFQTWEQIERAIECAQLSQTQQDESWNSLYLTTEQIHQVLKHVKKHARARWVYPMLAFAAWTGARRSEMIRSQVEDIGFDTRMVRIREKKKDQSRELTYRHVPMSLQLTRVLRQWLAEHPGGQYTFCEDANVRLTAVMTTHHFRWAVEDGKWHVLRGWHLFRHSFISNCASKGIDQRMIDAWSGHQTEEMRRRYTHLFPDQQQAVAGRQAAHIQRRVGRHAQSA